MKKLKKGFTLIELMVVMAIIAVLAVLIIGAINIARQSARNTTRQSDAKTFQTALEAYYASVKDYPGAVDTGSSVYGYSALSSYLTNFPTSDPNSENNRVVYCKKTTSTYYLYVVNQPTANPASAVCSPYNADGTLKSGYTDFSVK